MITSYCIDDITIIKYAGVDDYNEPDATTEVNVKGKIEHKTKLLSGRAGEDVVAGTRGMVVSSALIRMPLSIDAALGRALQYEDKLKYDDIEHAILKIDKPKAFSNPHYEVYVA